MKSFRKTLTVLFWLFAIIPVLWLSFNQLQKTKQQVVEFAKQQLVFDFNKKLTLLRSTLEKSFSDLDQIASDGSIITSSTMDMMSVKVVNKLQKFLDDNPNFTNIMILDESLFQIEAKPNLALTIDLSPFSAHIHQLFNDKNAVNDPSVRMIIIANKLSANDYLFSAARPILRPKESLVTPFEVSGVLFTTLPLNEFIEGLLSTIGSDGEDQISVYRNEQLIYQNKKMTPTINHISHQASFAIGNNPPFNIEVTVDLSSQLTLFALLTKEKNTLIFTLGLLWMILLSANYIIKHLLQPINDLKILTEKITNKNWQSGERVRITTKAHFKEFYELKLLLKSMADTIEQQFSELNSSNSQLTSLTEALQASVKQGDQHNEILQNLLDYDLFIRKQDDIEVISCLTLGLAYNILNEAIGIVIYRSNFQAGFKSLERANSHFLHYINQQHLDNIYFSSDEIAQINQVNEQYHLVAINRENNCLGYIVTQPIEQDSFKARAIDIFVSSLQSRLQELQLKNELSKLANTDALTGLYNRYFFDKTFTEYRMQYVEQQNHFAVMLIDINGLKKVNDELGHNAGDQLIIKIAEFLQHHIRTSDTLARIGGDEFVILLTGADSHYCQPLADKLMSQISHQRLCYKDSQLTMSFSCGFATTFQDPVDKLIDLADQRMYENKSKIANQLL